jgi:two-component sensor histidine kinase
MLHQVAANPTASSSNEAIAELDTFIAEANHRIANNLALIASVIRLQAADFSAKNQPLTSEQVRQALEEASGRIEAVGRLHRLLADLGRARMVELGAYLRQVTEAVVSSLAPKMRVRLHHTSTEGCLMLSEPSLRIGLIAGELVTNAIKYAHPTGVAGCISVGCRRRADATLVVEVADDGVGLPEGFDANVEGALGIRVLRSLAQQLGARLTFHNTGLGLRVELLVPPSGA